MTGDLIAFLNARLDEDEAAAKGAAGDVWEYRDTWVWCGPFEVADIFGGADMEEIGGHIARHDPARVLREVAAKRAIVATVSAYEAKIDGEWGCCHSATGIAGGYCPEIRPDDIRALRELAAVWSDHPDYRQEWAS